MKWSKEIREAVESQYQKLIEEVPELQADIYNRIEMEEEELSFLLKYLYSHMPLSDAVDYPYEMFHQFAVYGKELRENVVWNQEQVIPEELFLEDVLFHRVNTESITFCRELFASTLRDRVRGMAMEEAILEANYWCAEEATYQATDERTMSAEGVFRGAFGRCGEESVFAVNVLRSLGIPARQVYAHRWAHCDDNHAWVEVWCNGQWHFLGACEPEEMLDRGWFLNASSRAMMINSRTFGETLEQGDVLERCGITVGENQLSRYAKTETLKIIVTDDNGNGVADAEVTFSLLNYSELVPIATKRTDIHGVVTLETGKGSLWISVSKEDSVAETVVDVEKETECVLQLGRETEMNVWKSFDMNAPKGIPVHTKKPTEQQKQIGKEKFTRAVEKRLKKVSGFPGEDSGREFFLSRGNAEEIQKFYDSQIGNEEEKTWIFSELSIKDFRDVKAEILEEHLAGALSYQKEFEKDLFVPYVLNPRIYNETLKQYRLIIQQAFSEQKVRDFKEQPERIWDWIQSEIREVPEREYDEIFTTPFGCMKYRVGTRKSKKILFVAIARTFGIPARLDPVTRKMQYWKGHCFHTVQTETSSHQTGTLCVIGDEHVHWVYMQNWSIAKKEQNQWKTLQIGEGYQGNITLNAEEGEYRVITSNRLPNGNQFASVRIVSLNAEETKNIHLSLRDAKLDEMLNQTPLETFYVKTETGESLSSEQFLKNGMQLFIWAEVGKEPTEHIFNEMRDRQAEFAKYENTIQVILHDIADCQDPTFEKTDKALPNISVSYDDNHENVDVLARRMYGDPDKLPLILVVDQHHNGLYSTSGYNVGTGDMLLRILKHFK